MSEHSKDDCPYCRYAGIVFISEPALSHDGRFTAAECDSCKKQFTYVEKLTFGYVEYEPN